MTNRVISKDEKMIKNAFVIVSWLLCIVLVAACAFQVYNVVQDKHFNNQYLSMQQTHFDKNADAVDVYLNDPKRDNQIPKALIYAYTSAESVKGNFGDLADVSLLCYQTALVSIKYSLFLNDEKGANGMRVFMNDCRKWVDNYMTAAYK